MNDLNLVTQISMLPDHLKKEVEDFVQFLLEKSNRQKVPLEKIYGISKGMIKISDDFDEPLDDFKEYME